MKTVILAGGLGTRLAEYTNAIPKPMVKIGKYPIIVHIMSHYLRYGFNEFILATGYKSKNFKRYFKNFKKSGRPFAAVIIIALYIEAVVKNSIFCAEMLCL